MRHTILLASLLLLTAGCLGTTDDDPQAPGDDTSAPGSPATTWSTESFDGTVTGATAPGAGSVTQGGGNSATFQIPDGTRIAHLNVTTEGGDLDMQYGPDCQTDPTISCENTATTSDGALSIALRSPTSGSWDAFFFIAEETAAGEVSWTMDVTVGVVASTGTTG